MSVKVRQYRRRGQEKGFEVDISFKWPDGETYRERVKSPVASKAGAKAWGEQRLAELLRRGKEQSLPDAPTFTEFAKRFLEEHSRANRQKPSTIITKERILEYYLKPRFGSKRLDEIDDAVVQRLKADLHELSPKTVNNILVVLNTLLKAAVKWSVLPKLPATIELLKVPPREMVVYEPHDYERLVHAAAKVDRRYHAMVLLGGDAGLRTGEMMGLRWCDVDLSRGVLHIRRAIWRGQVVVPKSGKGRDVPMTSRLSACLASQKHLVRDEVLYRDGGHLTTRSALNKWLMRCERVANLEPVGALHKLRHTFCSRLAMKGAQAAAIQQLAGHSSYTTTARYVHLFQGQKESAISLLEAGGGFGGILEAPPAEPSRGAS